MPAEKHVYKVRTFECPSCGAKEKRLRWNYESVLQCPSCSSLMVEDTGAAFGTPAAVHGDEIDLVVPHAVCHEDGTPRRFRSRNELRQALESKGYKNPGAVNGVW